MTRLALNATLDHKRFNEQRPHVRVQGVFFVEAMVWQIYSFIECLRWGQNFRKYRFLAKRFDLVWHFTPEPDFSYRQTSFTNSFHAILSNKVLLILILSLQYITDYELVFVEYQTIGNSISTNKKIKQNICNLHVTSMSLYHKIDCVNQILWLFEDQ